MPRAGGGGGADRVDAELLGERAPEGRIVSVDVGLESGHGATVGLGSAGVNRAA
jgi:hypothetical protein